MDPPGATCRRFSVAESGPAKFRAPKFLALVGRLSMIGAVDGRRDEGSAATPDGIAEESWILISEIIDVSVSLRK
jgi:hypothetical protein